MIGRALRGAFLSTVLAAAAARAETSLTIQSEPGDPVGLGAALSVTPADGTFTAVRNFLGGVSVTFTGGGHEWQLDFADTVHGTLTWWFTPPDSQEWGWQASAFAG
jgi:hypothetical protein